jgi:hypothetical protein
MENASIVDPTNPLGKWDLIEDGATYRCYMKGTVPDGIAGHVPLAPWLSPSQFYGASGRSLAYKIPPTTAPGVINNNASDKIQHRIVTGSRSDAPTFPTIAGYSGKKCLGFAFKLGDGTPGSFQSVGDRLLFFQFWQGIGSGIANPPLRFQLKPYNGNGGQIGQIYTKNDSNAQGNEAESTLLKEFPISRDTWHRLVIEALPSYPGDGGPLGYVKVWFNGAQIVNWSGHWGYKPASVGGGVGINNRMDITTLIYRARQDRTHTIFFDNIKYGLNADDVQP